MAKKVQMTKEQAEKAMLEQIRSVWKTYKDFNPEGSYLTVTIIDADTVMFWDDPNQIGGPMIDYHGKV